MIVCSLYSIPDHLVSKNPKVLLNTTKLNKWCFDKTIYVTVDYDSKIMYWEYMSYAKSVQEFESNNHFVFLLSSS